MRRTILKVAVPSPLLRTFDYQVPMGVDPGAVTVGCRVRVPFGQQKRLGIILAVADSTDVPEARLRRAEEIVDEQPVLCTDLLQLGEWATRYYHHPPGEVFATMLPALLRKGAAARAGEISTYRLSAAGRIAMREENALSRAPRQKDLLSRLQGAGGCLDQESLDKDIENWRRPASALIEKGWIDVSTTPLLPGSGPTPPESAPRLTHDQARALGALQGHQGSFAVSLLEGITGSGKTEIYLSAVGNALANGRQALVLVPEIGLTPQLLDTFRRRLGIPLGVLHSSLTDRQRLNVWATAREGSVRVVIGTRSAVFTPMRRPGLIVVDEEHDPSFKQTDGFRYSARDLAIVRARNLNIPVLMGSATPALETLNNAITGRYQHLSLRKRVSGAPGPSLELLDTRNLPMDEGLSMPLIERMRTHLEHDEQVLVFLNRRGFAPTLLCHACGWVDDCARCDAHLTLHVGRKRMVCHHCGVEKAVAELCPTCGSVDLRAVGQGTERIEHALSRHFPDRSIVRIDRDSTRRKGELESLLGGIRAGTHRLLIGTQMLAKGHDFPSLTLVAVVDADQGLFSADFRAGERLAQLIVQVAGRAGRAERPGSVVIQTHHPDHPLLQTLVREGYPGFARAALAERAAAGLPPFAHHAVLRAEAVARAAPEKFLREAVGIGGSPSGVELWGPVPSPMEKRAGRWRAQVLVQAARRVALHEFLDSWAPRLESLASARKVRWSLDVDPMDLF